MNIIDTIDALKKIYALAKDENFSSDEALSAIMQIAEVTLENNSVLVEDSDK